MSKNFLKWFCAPKSSMSISFSVINHPFWGAFIHRNPPLNTLAFACRLGCISKVKCKRIVTCHFRLTDFDDGFPVVHFPHVEHSGGQVGDKWTVLFCFWENSLFLTFLWLFAILFHQSFAFLTIPNHEPWGDNGWLVVYAKPAVNISLVGWSINILTHQFLEVFLSRCRSIRTW